MLALLNIENIAVIECAEIAFDRGFNVLTGETGAGKSIVIDAISAILGERVYRDVIRTGANRAFASAIFRDVPELPWFAENHVPYEEETLIQREIFLDGKNGCRVNGQPVTVGILRKLGLQLINIHGQHDSQQLFDESNHLTYLDAFAGDSDELAAYSTFYRQVLQLRSEIEKLQMDESEKLRRTESLRYQIDEISRADLKPGEDVKLEARRKVLQNAEKLSGGVVSALESLNGGDSSEGALALLSEAARALERISRFSEELGQLGGKITDLYYQVQDISESLHSVGDDMAYSGDELEQIESRLDIIHRLRRKYGDSCEAILAYMKRAQQELDEIVFSDERIAKLQKQLTEAEISAASAARALHDRRAAAASALSDLVLEELRQLDMPKVRFVCALSETELSPTGTDQAAFYLSANVGEALKPLSKVASGGELARIMLALKNVMASQDHVGTLIFDEVDAGVSGRAAQKVAEKLHSVAQSKQVLCVTHLPQIAAMADTHLLIRKEERDGRTYTTVTQLNREGRKRELARIIGGAEITETTLKSAEEMLPPIRQTDPSAINDYGD